jgi:hypothetical protein
VRAIGKAVKWGAVIAAVRRLFDASGAWPNTAPGFDVSRSRSRFSSSSAEGFAAMLVPCALLWAALVSVTKSICS